MLKIICITNDRHASQSVHCNPVQSRRWLNFVKPDGHLFNLLISLHWMQQKLFHFINWNVMKRTENRMRHERRKKREKITKEIAYKWTIKNSFNDEYGEKDSERLKVYWATYFIKPHAVVPLFTSLLVARNVIVNSNGESHSKWEEIQIWGRKSKRRKSKWCYSRDYRGGNLWKTFFSNKRVSDSPSLVARY